MISSRFLIILLVMGLLFTGSSAMAAMEITEIKLISDILHKNVQDCKRLMHNAYRMREQALPFTDERHAAKYRFKPADSQVREILTLTRVLRSRFKLLTGILYHAPTDNRTKIFKAVNVSLDKVMTASKRALRGIKDGNFALYMASSQTADREARILTNYLADIENLVNQSILATDELRENL